VKIPESARRPILLAWLRIAVVLVGVAAGTLLVRALDQGLARGAAEGAIVERALTAGHFLFGMVLALAVSPGPPSCLFVGLESGEKSRGLAFGGCVVTAFVAMVGGAFLWQRGVAPENGGGPAAWLGLAWCALALPVAVVDAIRIRFGAGADDESVA
jgi:hypothetical protein